MCIYYLWIYQQIHPNTEKIRKKAIFVKSLRSKDFKTGIEGYVVEKNSGRTPKLLEFSKLRHNFKDAGAAGV